MKKWLFFHGPGINTIKKCSIRNERPVYFPVFFFFFKDLKNSAQAKGLKSGL